MGLLDSLTYGSGGGLLDFLRNNALNQQFSSGLPSDQAQYGQSPLYSPPMQAMAQTQPQQPPPVIQAQPMQAPQQAPQQYQAQQPQAPQGPGFGDHLMAGLQGFANSGGILPALANGISGLTTGVRSDPAGQAQAQAQQVQNVTLRALLQKGVDPVTAQAAIGQPKLLEALVNQNFGPQTVQSLGGGYIYNPKTGKTERAYEPEDKIPAGFEKDAKGNMHFIPNGPADPAYIQLAEAKKKDPNGVFTLGRGGELYKIDKDGQPVIVHKNAEAEGEPLTDAAVSLAADRAIAGDGRALTNLGRGAQGRADLVKINNAIAEKMKDNPNAAKQIQQNVAQQAGLVSSSRALGTKETHFGVAEKAMEESIPLAQAASDAVPRSDWMTVNKFIQKGQTEHSNPALKKFLIANDTAVKDYARTINPTGALRESDIEYARKTLSTADGPDAYAAGLQQLQQEAGVMKRAIQRQKLELQGKEAAPANVSRSEAEAELRRRGLIK